MLARLVPLLVVAATLGGSSGAQTPPKIEAAAWLAGCWSFARDGGLTEEYWLPPAGGAMLGVGRTVRGGKMTEHEFLAIQEVDGRLSYVAIPSGQKRTVFPFVRASENELASENPQHDFPQRLIYRKALDRIAARIEGSIGGQALSVDFPFRRCRRGDF